MIRNVPCDFIVKELFGLSFLIWQHSLLPKEKPLHRGPAAAQQNGGIIRFEVGQ